MASTTTLAINITFPVAGQDNDTQEFRNNFSRIQDSLIGAETKIDTLESTISTLGGSVYVTATHVVARQDVTIGGDVITVDENSQLVVTANGKSGTLVMRPNTVIAYGAYALTESVTSSSTGTFAVDDVRNLQVGATITFPLISGIFTVTNVNTGLNFVTVTPQFNDSPAPFNVGQQLLFTNPFFGTTSQTGDLYVTGNIYATGNITAFYGSTSDARLKENVRKIENSLEKVRSLEGVLYDWTEAYLSTQQLPIPKEDTGVIAQDVQKVLPEAVVEKTDGYLTVKYEKLVGLLIQSIKELADEVDEIKKKL